MASITIGDKKYIVPELNFVAIERAWPKIEEALIFLNHPIKATSAGLHVIAASLMEQEDFNPSLFGIGPDEVLDDDEVYQRVTEFLKKKLKASQVATVADFMITATVEAGLVPKEGEAETVEEESPSPEIAPSSLPSSSPLASKEAPGMQ